VLLFVRFQRSLKVVVVLKIQSGGQPSILQGNCKTKHISVWGINISLWEIRVAEKEGLLLKSFGIDIWQLVEIGIGFCPNAGFWSGLVLVSGF
jgi:hypothetical protein